MTVCARQESFIEFQARLIPVGCNVEDTLFWRHFYKI